MCLAFVLKHGLNAGSQAFMPSPLPTEPSSFRFVFFLSSCLWHIDEEVENSEYSLSSVLSHCGGVRRPPVHLLCSHPHSCILRFGSESCIVPTQHTYCHPCVPSTFEFLSCTREREDVLGVKGEPWKMPPRQGGRGNERGGQERGIFFKKPFLFHKFCWEVILANMAVLYEH